MTENAKEFVKQILKETGRNVFVLCLSFEDRCRRLAEILSEDWIDRTKNRVICASLSDENVNPLVSWKRSQIKKEMETLLGPEFLTTDDIKQKIDEEICRHDSRIIIDASGMPRKLVFQILDNIQSRRPYFQSIHLTYNHPKEYLLGELEIPSPAMALYFRNPLVHNAEKISLVIFPGFNTAETALVLGKVLDSNMDRRVRIFWYFVHPGRQLAFYERAMCEHRPFLEYLRGIPNELKLCRMNDFQHIASEIVVQAKGLVDDEILILAGLGPRIITVPMFLTTIALRKRRINANVFVPEPIFYNSLRSRDIADHMDAWDIHEEYSKISVLSETIKTQVIS